ncbi:MAG: hypothetical protein LBS60_01240 [Deltaproteobacteria bacterium]|jgi:hypothetical protein|nr:hypothetical protein [Deltaproteobacteria bacterium]
MKQPPNTPDTPSSEIPKSPKIRDQVINGVRYVYEDLSYWDKSKKQTVQKRIYIGHYTDKGKFVKSKSFLLAEKNKAEAKSLISNHKFFGATHLLDTIARKIGLFEDLKKAFPSEYGLILSLAFYFVLESEDTIARFKKWEKFHYTPLTKAFTSAQINDLLFNLSPEKKSKFFSRQAARHSSPDYLAYDINCVPSYPELISQVKLGLFLDDNSFSNLNISFVLGEKSLSPVYYDLLTTKTDDITVFLDQVLDSTPLLSPRFVFVTKQKNQDFQHLQSLFVNKFNFIAEVYEDSPFYPRNLVNLSADPSDWPNYLEDFNLYNSSSEVELTLPLKGKGSRTRGANKVDCFLHVFSDPNWDASDAPAKGKIGAANYKKGKLGPMRVPHRLSGYSTSLPTINMNGVVLDSGFIDSVSSANGTFALLSNYISDPVEAITIYKNKYLIEKSFSNLLTRFNLGLSSERAEGKLDGALFIQYIAFILTFYVQNVMWENKIHNDLSIDELLDELDSIERFEYEPSKYRYNEITKSQHDLFSLFDIDIESETKGS